MYTILCCGEQLRLFGTHLSTVGRDRICCHQHGEHTLDATRASWQPSRQMIEGFPRVKSEHDNHTSSSAQIGRRDGKEPLLSCCVAYLQS